MSRANGARARFERVRCALDRFGISIPRGLLQRRESYGSVFGERGEKIAEHFLDASLAKVRAEALQVYARWWPRGF